MTSVLLMAAVAQVAFSIETAKPTYLAGEPIVVTVTQHGSARLHPDGWYELGFAGSHIRVLVDRGRGFERFQRKVLTAPFTHRDGPRLFPDGNRQEFVLSYDDAIGDVVFPAAGNVRLAFEYEDPSVGRVRSNVVTLRIEAPEGDERRAWEAMRALPERGFQFYVELTEVEAAPVLSDEGSRRLIASFPASVYLQGARVRSLAAYRQGTLDEALGLAGDLAGGQFEADALAALAGAYEAVGQDEQARWTWQHIIERFPSRAAADEAREALAPDDDEDEGPPR